MEKRIDFAIKNREEVIDSLQLRAKEKQVLLALILILVSTIAYENGAFILNYFVSENFEVPTLGKRKNLLVKADVVKQMFRRIDGLKNVYPQFFALFESNEGKLNQALDLMADENTKEEASTMVVQVALDLWKFSTHPVLPKTDQIEELEKYLMKLQKRLKIDFRNEFVISEINFSRAESAGAAKIRRNLFDYEKF